MASHTRSNQSKSSGHSKRSGKVIHLSDQSSVSGAKIAQTLWTMGLNWLLERPQKAAGRATASCGGEDWVFALGPKRLIRDGRESPSLSSSSACQSDDNQECTSSEDEDREARSARKSSAHKPRHRDYHDELAEDEEEEHEQDDAHVLGDKRKAKAKAKKIASKNPDVATAASSKQTHSRVAVVSSNTKKSRSKLDDIQPGASSNSSTSISSFRAGARDRH